MAWNVKECCEADLWGCAKFYSGMERDMANHIQGWEQPVLDNVIYLNGHVRLNCCICCDKLFFLLSSGRPTLLHFEAHVVLLRFVQHAGSPFGPSLLSR